MSTPDSAKVAKFWLVVALILILGGGLLAYLIQTSGGVKVRDLRFMGADGKMVSALLYIPPNATKKTPAPAVVATHGYINSRETQDGFAIELARRGFVVLAPDQSGHGFSGPPAFANGFGGLDTLKYLRTLDFVDPKNIGLEGHSMGGWASVIAAAANPDGYKSFVLASSSTGTYGAPNGTPTFPRNMAVIYSLYDEFSQLMWGVPIPSQMPGTDKLKKIFNTKEPVKVGQLYGSIEDGTARILYQPRMIHPRVHLSTEAIGNAIEWFQKTLKGHKNIPPADQIWPWKELGNLIALIGMVLLLFPVGSLLLRANYFKVLKEAPAERKSLTGWGWYVGAVVMMLLPIPVYMNIWDWQGKGIMAKSFLWGQQITTVLIFWAMIVAAIALILFLLWHFILNKKTGATCVSYGMCWPEKGLQWGKIGRSLLLAVLVSFAAYFTLAFSFWLFDTDYRFWVFAVKPMSASHAGMFLAYLVPFYFYFLIAGLVLHGQLRRGKANGPDLAGWKEMVINIVLMIGGYILFEAYHYLPLFVGGSLGVTTRWAPLYGIVMFQFLPIFTIVALVSTYFYRRTGHIYVGSFINAMLVTWIVVAGQATHYAY
ncbi:MAG: alpha/beta fold hydrolase [Thermodesulfobacteriota bacterium]